MQVFGQKVLNYKLSLKQTLTLKLALASISLNCEQNIFFKETQTFSVQEMTVPALPDKTSNLIFTISKTDNALYSL